MMKSIAPKYDLFKIITAILLVISLILISRYSTEMVIGGKNGETTVEEEESQEPKSVGKDVDLKLPDFPNTSVILEFEPNAKSLVDPYGKQRFFLNEKGDSWTPIVPKDITDDLGENYSLGIDESKVWHARNITGMQFTLDMKSLDWTRELELKVEAEGGKPTENEIENCEGANPARISGVGEKVAVINSLIPLRSTPDAVSDNVLKALPIGTSLEIIASPVCTEYLDGANLWWGVQTEGGQTGWAAEGSALGFAYYLELIE